jgi:hypothetical protein
LSFILKARSHFVAQGALELKILLLLLLTAGILGPSFMLGLFAHLIVVFLGIDLCEFFTYFGY